jgi:hypothetical protein
MRAWAEGVAQEIAAPRLAADGAAHQGARRQHHVDAAATPPPILPDAAPAAADAAVPPTPNREAMMNKILSGLAIATLMTACVRAETAADSTATTTSDPVITAAATAKAIEANPAGADSILKAAGHTPDSFQQLMYDIASDSTKAAAFAAARKP